MQFCLASASALAALSAAGSSRAGAVRPPLSSYSSPQLVTSYSACTNLLLNEIENTLGGDSIDLGIYLLEGGSSSESVLSALEEAGAQRGVRVTFRLDTSYVSEISRIIEKTDTLIPRVARLALTEPQWCSCAWGSKPDHGKFALFTRRASSSAPDSAILGGINFGDRFTEWDDYAVRLEGRDALALRTSLLGEVSEAAEQGGWRAKPPSVDAARVIAYASPAVAFVTTITAAAMTATASLALPAALVTGTPDALWAGLGACAWGGATSATLGAAFASACDGAPFSLTRELAGFARSLVFDRSALGDALAPLRRVYVAGAEGRGGPAADTAVREWRYLPAAAPLATNAGIDVVCNRREQRRYEIEPTFRALFSDTRLGRYRVAMAYLGHRWGVEVLEYALARGAVVELLLPARANVYAHENLKAAQTLLDRGWPGLRLYLHPEMVHAKATLARPAEEAAGVGVGEGKGEGVAADDAAVAFLGSANLVRGSMNLPVHCGLLPYDELNVLVRDTAFCDALDASMDGLFERATRIMPGTNLLEASDWYSERRAQWEELWQ